LSTAASPASGLEWHEENVTIGDVLNALNGIRKKFAMAEAGDEEQPHPRRRVMTLVAIAATETEERRAQRAAKAIAAHHPSLAIVVRDNPELAAGEIAAWVTSDAHLPATTGAVQFELVTLHVRGAAGDHLAALIDPLLLSGVPTYLWWVGTPPFGERELDDALKVCDALVVDSARFDAPYRSFLALAQLTASSHRRLGLADFQWARLTPWRESIAQFFSPADRRDFLSGIAEIGIDYAGDGRGNRVAAALLVGWLGSTLGWKMQRAAGGAGGIVVAHFVAERWRPLEVAFRSVPKAHLAPGELSTIHIVGASGGRTFELSVRRDPERPRRPAPDIGQGGFKTLHPPGGEDDAGWEIAERNAARHRGVLNDNRDALHHSATGDPPGESLPPYPTVFVRERRRADTSLVLLTLIDIGGADTLRHVQRVEPEDEAALLLDLLSTGAHDDVYARSLVAAAELMRAV
jgi:glucose-6-phosphate dehydrogenase assembly protein OpcA